MASLLGNFDNSRALEHQLQCKRHCALLQVVLGGKGCKALPLVSRSDGVDLVVVNVYGRNLRLSVMVLSRICERADDVDLLSASQKGKGDAFPSTSTNEEGKGKVAWA